MYSTKLACVCSKNYICRGFPFLCQKWVSYFGVQSSFLVSTRIYQQVCLKSERVESYVVDHLHSVHYICSTHRSGSGSSNRALPSPPSTISLTLLTWDIKSCHLQEALRRGMSGRRNPSRSQPPH